jgi:hypothetical protein
VIRPVLLAVVLIAYVLSAVLARWHTFREVVASRGF